ncbi:MAG: hypothetical protein Q7T20_08040 [Saprospiraceae bacterium]|nr:hypothetical protein [Saprospiraceae bacterium]
MKILLLLCLILWSLRGLAQQDATPGDGCFDPLRDPVAGMVNGRLHLVLNSEVLVRAVAGNLPRLGTIEKVECQNIEDQWWLTLESRHTEDIEQSVFVAVRLKPDLDGNFFADSYWTACTGEGCGGCDFKLQMDGCFCRFDRPGEPGTPGSCYQTSSDEMLMVKVPLKSSRK